MRLPDIKRHSGRALGLSRAQMEGRSHARPVAHPRQVVMVMCRRYSGESLSRIGDSLGRRDHTTVLYGLRAVEARCAKYPKYFRKVSTICALIEAEILHNLIAAQDRPPPQLVTPPAARLLLPAPWHRLAKGAA